jgi:hypothetical protein
MPVFDARSKKDIVFVGSWTDFPTPSNGVITLLDNYTYFITSDVDLLGNRLVGGSDTTIIGGSSENCSITSTGLSVGVALLTTQWTTPIRNITFKDVDTCLSIDGSINPPLALDWTGLNFQNIPNIGTISTCDNWIYSKGAFLNSQGLVFTGSIGTVGIDNSIFVGSGSAGSIISLDAGLTITRRFRAIYSSIIAFGSTIGVNANLAATIPTEGYIYDTINFSGGGTYLNGIDELDNRTRIGNSKGVKNTTEIGNYFMLNNSTQTVIASAGVPVKIAGTTTANTINQKFTHTDNRLTYTGGLLRNFQISGTASFTSGNNQVIGLYVSKNGTLLTNSEMYATTSGSGRAESIHIQTILELDENDYIEIWIENDNSSQDITVEFLNLICKSLD